VVLPLLDHQARLEQEVSDRTQDLSEAMEAAEAANSAKSRSRTVSRSPLKLVASRPTSSSATSGIAARRP
jgi:hypothetical protein